MAVSSKHKGWLLKHNEGILAAVYDGAMPGTTLLSANTALDGVFVGTPVVPALAVDSLAISNTVASGDVVIAANRAGNSEAYLIVDSSAGTLTLKSPAGAMTFTPTTDLVVSNGTGLIVGNATQVTSVAAAELQVLGTAAADSMITVGCFSTTDTIYPRLGFLKSGNAAIGGNTIVASGEYLGAIEWYADDGADYVTPAAAIRAEVDTAAPGENDMPGRILFLTTSDAGNTVTERMRISAAGLVTIASGNITLTAAGDLVIPANTAVAWEIYDATTKIVAVDTRTTMKDISSIIITGVAPTIASETAAHVNSSLHIAAKTITYTGGTATTSSLGAQLSIAAPTFTDATSMTLTTASSVHINAVAAAGGSLTISNSRMISTSVTDCYLTNAGVWTDTACTAKVKQDIQDLDPDTMPGLIDQIRPVTYRYDPVKLNANDLNRQRYGIVAEELPEFLRVPGEVNPSGLSGTVLAAFGLAGLRYLHDTAKALTEKLTALDSRLTAAGI